MYVCFHCSNICLVYPFLLRFVENLICVFNHPRLHGVCDVHVPFQGWFALYHPQRGFKKIGISSTCFSWCLYGGNAWYIANAGSIGIRRYPDAYSMGGGKLPIVDGFKFHGPNIKLLEGNKSYDEVLAAGLLWQQLTCSPWVYVAFVLEESPFYLSHKKSPCFPLWELVNLVGILIMV